MNTRPPNHGVWTDRLSDFLDGGLQASEHAQVETHLKGCGSCRAVLAELRDIRERAARLGPVAPPEDLWQAISATIAAPGPAPEPADVIALPTPALKEGGGGGDSARFTLTLSASQLAAAAVAVIAVSSLLTWWAGPGSGAGVADATDRAGALAGSVRNVISGDPPAGLVDELEALERSVAARRSSLDPNTLRVLERNLGVIEQAIEDSRLALALDPDNEFLTDHLERVYERKLEYLRDAARVAEWEG